MTDASRLRPNVQRYSACSRVCVRVDKNAFKTLLSSFICPAIQRCKHACTGWPKKLYFFQHAISLEPFEIKRNGFQQKIWCVEKCTTFLGHPVQYICTTEKNRTAGSDLNADSCPEIVNKLLIQLDRWNAVPWSAYCVSASLKLRTAGEICCPGLLCGQSYFQKVIENFKMQTSSGTYWVSSSLAVFFVVYHIFLFSRTAVVIIIRFER